MKTIRPLLSASLAVLFSVGTAFQAQKPAEPPEIKAQFGQFEGYLDAQLERSWANRDSNWKRDFSSIESYEKSIASNRRRFVEAIGGLPRVTEPLKPRIETIAEEASYRAERVWLNVAPGLEVYGILLRPRAATGKHPALICVHGLGSSPERVCGTLPEDYTKNFGVRAAKLGYVVFAPFITNDVKLKARLDRKAVLLGTRLQGIEEGKILRVVDFL